MSKENLSSQADLLVSDVQANNDRLAIDAATLLGRFGIEELNEETAAGVSRELKQRGVTATPSLKKLLDMFGKRVEGSDIDDENYACSTQEVAGSEVVLTRGSAMALQGAIAATVLFTVVGLFGFWLYGLIALLLGLFGTAVVLVGFAKIDQTFPAGWPRGRLLGGAIATVFILIIGLAICMPIRQVRKDHAKEAKAQQFLDLANGKINENKAAEAADLVQQAMIVDPSYPPIVVTGQRLQTLQLQTSAALLDAQGNTYDEAKELLSAGKTAEAANLFYGIRGVRDVDAIIAKNARKMSIALAARAKSLLSSDPKEAAHFADQAALIAPSKQLANASVALSKKARALAAKQKASQ